MAITDLGTFKLNKRRQLITKMRPALAGAITPYDVKVGVDYPEEWNQGIVYPLYWNPENMDDPCGGLGANGKPNFCIDVLASRVKPIGPRIGLFMQPRQGPRPWQEAACVYSNFELTDGIYDVWNSGGLMSRWCATQRADLNLPAIESAWPSAIVPPYGRVLASYPQSGCIYMQGWHPSYYWIPEECAASGYYGHATDRTTFNMDMLPQDDGKHGIGCLVYVPPYDISGEPISWFNRFQSYGGASMGPFHMYDSEPREYFTGVSHTLWVYGEHTAPGVLDFAFTYTLALAGWGDEYNEPDVGRTINYFFAPPATIDPASYIGQWLDCTLQVDWPDVRAWVNGVQLELMGMRDEGDATVEPGTVPLEIIRDESYSPLFSADWHPLYWVDPCIPGYLAELGYFHGVIDQ